MKQQKSSGHPHSNLSHSGSIDQACDRFESAWQQGRRPQPEDYLQQVSEPLYSSLLRVLLYLDAEYRRSHGEPLARENYSARFPDHAQLIDEVFEHSASCETVRPTRTRTPQQAEGVVTAAARYRDLQFHAGGGLGEVYRAHDDSLNRDVALKFIRHTHLAANELRRRFVVEAEVTSRLDHPGVVPVYTIGESWDGRPFYAMRYIEGTSLQTAIDQFHTADWSRGEAACQHELRRLVRHLAAGCHTVAYANNRCIVHCDIKPANIMLGRFGETLVVDWGMAVLVQRDVVGMEREEQTLLLRSSEAGDTSSVSGGGTLPFMSPEQCPGSTQPITPRSDVYALGATLYSLLTGRSRFGRLTQNEVYDRIRHGDFPPPRQAARAGQAAHANRPKALTAGQIPPALEAICMKALQTRPEDRYPSATQMAEDLECWLSDETVSVYREPLFERSLRLLRKHRSWTQSLSVALLLVLVTATVSAVMLGGMYQRESDARLAAAEAQQDALWMAAHYTAEALGNEVDLRWQILEGAAADEVPVENLQVAADQRPVGSEPQQRLQAWITETFFENQTLAPSASWFLTDASGLMVARHPPSHSVGRSFAHREYFHGDPQHPDAKPEATPRPIERSHLSTAFVSHSNGNLRVSFSFPVWDTPPDNSGRQVIGVLGMSVEMADFHALAGHGEKWLVSLVDLKADGIKSKLQRGLVLHHPELARMRFEQSVEDVAKLTWRLSDEQLAKCKDVAHRAFVHEQRWRQLLHRGHHGYQRQPVAGSLQQGYQDPIMEGGDWLAALAPVLVSGRASQASSNDVTALQDIGWMVIVQQQYVPVGTEM